jgi:TRAP-type C4-dicarboxylate transport system permease small subunit
LPTGPSRRARRTDNLGAVLETTRKVLRTIANGGVHLAAILVVVTMVAIVANAFYRYIFGGGIHLVIELAGFVFLWLIFLSVAGTFLAGGHVTVELVTDNLPPRVQRVLRARIVPVLAAVYVAMIGWAGFVVARDLVIGGETSIGAIQFPLWPAFIVMPVGCLLLLIAIVQVLLGGEEPQRGRRLEID